MRIINTNNRQGEIMFSITDLIRKTADVLNHVQKHGIAEVKGKGRPAFVVVEKIEYYALLKDRDMFMDETAKLDKEIEYLKKELDKLSPKHSR